MRRMRTSLDFHEIKSSAMIFRNSWRSLSTKLKRTQSEDKFANYKGVRVITIRKGTASLGIMIIEGRHAEVGRGIFISDIQEGSAAEQAGLQVGDLILAVNKDSLLSTSYDEAASLLKRTEGVVQLTVCNPNKTSDGDTAGTADTSGGLPAGEGKAAPKPPAKAEPPPDPATVPITPGKDTVIELPTNSQSPGLLVVGGANTAVQGGAVIMDIIPGGVADKDGRLMPGDQILDCNGTAITKEMSNERMRLTVKHKVAKLKMTIHRPESIPYQDIATELSRKAGKGLGLSIVNRTPPPGSYIAEIVPGGPADVDGKLQQYDLISSVDGKEVFSSPHEEVALALKAVSGKVAIKAKRFKVVR